MPADIEKLQKLILRLRSPDGCPWDREQTLQSVRAYLLEEAHEAAAAIDGGDRRELLGELGDLLFQAVFIARLAEEEGAFTLGDAIDAVHGKMIERHPHVFGDTRLADAAAVPRAESAAAVHRAWEQRKAEPGRSVLQGIPTSLPALTGAYRMTQKAAGVDFDWPDADAVALKIREEMAEVEQTLETGDSERQREEVGDLLFTVVNLARHLGFDPEASLAAANRKFRRRFEAMEGALAKRGLSVASASPQEMDEAWNQIKRLEHKP